MKTLILILLVNFSLGQQNNEINLADYRYGIMIYKNELTKVAGDTIRKKGCKYKRIYDANRILKEEGCTLGGKKEGLWNVYTENGWIRFVFFYINGKKNGPYKVMEETGKISAIGFYKNGTITDTLYSYAESGELVSKTVWRIADDEASSFMVWSKIYNKNAKPDGTLDTINGRRYKWHLGKRVEIN